MKGEYMLHKQTPKSFGKVARFSLVCLGASLLIFQPVRGSAQVYTYGGGINGSSQFTDNGNGNQTLDFTGSQTGFGTLGLAVGQVPADPTLTVTESINNESSFVWTEYVLNLAMAQTFTINSGAVTAPAGWLATITQPTGPDGSGNYNGVIDYYMTTGGTPVAIYPAANSTLYLGYQITFNSTTGSYSVITSATPVPEPGVFSFVLVGGLLLGGWMFAKRGQVKLQRQA